MRKRIRPALNAQCLCGSGLKFKRCCHGDNDAPCTKYIRLGRIELDNGNGQLALAHTRKAITNYTILHKTNTAPYLPTNNAGFNWLLGVDIDALSELLENLYSCYRKIGDYKSFEIDLERLRGNITDLRWQKKITYFQVLASLGDHWSEEVGKKRVEIFSPIEEEMDPKIIQLYLHFRSEDIAFKRSVELIERVIELSERPGEKLQYSVLKGIKYLYIGDELEAGDIIQEAISDFECAEFLEDAGHSRMQYALALGILADLRESESLKIKSICEFEKLVELDLWTEKGRAQILLEIGRALLSINRFEDSISYFQKSLSIFEADIVKVFMCQSLLESKDILAISIIEEVELNSEKLSEAERLDFAFTYAAVGIAYKKREMVGKALEHLSNFANLEPVFEKQRVKLITEISILFKKNQFEGEGVLLSALKRVMRATSRYLILQPNVAGLGVNINNIMEDMSKKSGK